MSWPRKFQVKSTLPLSTKFLKLSPLSQKPGPDKLSPLSQTQACTRMLPGVSTSSWNNPRFCSFEKENGTYLSKRCKGAFWAEKGALSSRLLYVARIPCVEALKRQIFLTLFQHFFHCWLERFSPLYFAIHGPAAGAEAAVLSSWTTRALSWLPKNLLRTAKREH